MGDSNVKKGELIGFARKVGEVLAEHDARIHSLALSFDCLIAVLDGVPRLSSDGATEHPRVAERVKTEIDRRIQAAKDKATAGRDTSGEPYDPTAPANIAAHAKARRERTGCYAPGASDDPDKEKP